MGWSCFPVADRFWMRPLLCTYVCGCGCECIVLFNVCTVCRRTEERQVSCDAFLVCVRPSCRLPVTSWRTVKGKTDCCYCGHVVDACCPPRPSALTWCACFWACLRSGVCTQLLRLRSPLGILISYDKMWLAEWWYTNPLHCYRFFVGETISPTFFNTGW